MKIKSHVWSAAIVLFVAAGALVGQADATKAGAKAAPKAATKAGTKAGTKAAATKAGETKAEPKAGEPAAPPRENGYYATLTTSQGPITIKLFEKESPKTVKNFVDLAMGRKEFTDPTTQKRVKRPLYNGLIFHRVIPGFMIQGGDPTGTGMGGTDVIPDEFDPSLNFDVPGRLAMANAGPGTGSCQFFITEGPTPHLNGRHTIFGQVVEGQDVVNKIANTPRGANDRPNTPQKIIKVTFQRVGPPPAGAAPAATKAGTKAGIKAGTKAAPKATPKAAK